AVLRGETSEQVASRGHDRLSVFGLLNAMPAVEIRNYIDQLTQSGFLERVGDQYPTIQITGPGADLLRGRVECVLFRQPRPVSRRGKRRRGERERRSPDAALLDRLRALRAALARARGVPPYVVFHDTTLRELAARRPTSLADLLEISGIGERKAEVYGAALLDEIARQ